MRWEFWPDLETTFAAAERFGGAAEFFFTAVALATLATIALGGLTRALRFLVHELHGLGLALQAWIEEPTVSEPAYLGIRRSALAG